ncbi:Zinc-regulated transporter 1 [Yarrowia sp. C11]|nr:Zinc-regulated transporter 1 [Yarrowia sp. E02]KAG5372330.1 Zinc-regulated transporter 1 [Yarrowia sp. C11]
MRVASILPLLIYTTRVTSADTTSADLSDDFYAGSNQPLSDLAIELPNEIYKPKHVVHISRRRLICRTNEDTGEEICKVDNSDPQESIIEEVDCSKKERSTNIGLRVGALFAVLGTSALGVFPPVLAESIWRINLETLPMTFIKQFGTGVVLSTAFVHLGAEATEEFNNPCIGEIEYKPTPLAFVLAGLFISFLIEYLGARILRWRANTLEARRNENENTEEIKCGHNHSHVVDNTGGDTEDPDCTGDVAVQEIVEDVIEKAPSRISTSSLRRSSTHIAPPPPIAGGCHSHGLIDPTDKFSVWIMEAGIIFHSVLVGVTVSLAEEDTFITLFIAILFHQMFEGVGLGSRIAGLKDSRLISKCLMCLWFSIITPIGMAIGLGVLDHFEENPTTLWALGSIDGLCCGVLVYAGVVEMLGFDWLFGDLQDAPPLRVCTGLVGLTLGMLLMSLVGHWA